MDFLDWRLVAVMPEPGRRDKPFAHPVAAAEALEQTPLMQ
jgi:hypothetical protein